MDASRPVSVLLPTVTWTPACAETAEQLGPEDELLVIPDDESDPVADRAGDLPDGVRLVVAGEPRGCSGKANAIAAGMEAARHDRIVWTDDDFSRPPDWLATLRTDYERRGPVSEIPLYVGRDPLSTLLEPVYLVGGTAVAYSGDKPWGGSVIFERDDIDEAAFLDELRRTVSDDGLLGEHLDVTSVKRTWRVPIGGTIRDSLERHARWMQIAHRHGPQSAAGVILTAVLLALPCLLFPVPAFGGAALLAAAFYAGFGLRRWTFVLASPALVVHLPLTVYALVRRTFVWGGRRYRWRGKFDVTVDPE